MDEIFSGLKLSESYTKMELVLLEAIVEGFKKKSVEIIESVTNRKNYNNHKLDLLLKNFLLELFKKNNSSDTLQDFITFVIEASRKGLVSYSLPVALLKDLFDLTTFQNYKKMFDYVEDNLDVWREDIFFADSKNNMLRMCNELIKKSPQSTDFIFHGRIHKFLAKLFPLNECLGLNVSSEFSSDYTYEFQTASKSVYNYEKDFYYNSYITFCMLQEFFKSPIQLYDEKKWYYFCDYTNIIVSIFKETKLDVCEAFNEDFGITPYSRYLINPEIFREQLKDVTFMRNVSIQFLIIFQYLTLNDNWDQCDSFGLDKKQIQWIQSMEEEIYSLLKKSQPHGDCFTNSVKNILKREEFYIIKDDSFCPDLKTYSKYTATEEMPKQIPKILLGDILKDAHKNGKVELCNPQLTRLWNLSPDDLKVCNREDFIPSVDSYFECATQQLNINGESELLKDSAFAWRGLRILAKKSNQFFNTKKKEINEISKYLKNILTIQDQKELFSSSFGSSVQDRMEDDELIKFNNFFLSKLLFEAICRELESSWQILAIKLGYKPEEIEFVAKHTKNNYDAVTTLLHLWFGEETYPTLEKFFGILRRLKLDKAASMVKIAIDQNLV